jgi:hypothetical protein
LYTRCHNDVNFAHGIITHLSLREDRIESMSRVMMSYCRNNQCAWMLPCRTAVMFRVAVTFYLPGTEASSHKKWSPTEDLRWGMGKTSRAHQVGPGRNYGAVESMRQLIFVMQVHSSCECRGDVHQGRRSHIQVPMITQIRQVRFEKKRKGKARKEVA